MFELLQEAVAYAQSHLSELAGALGEHLLLVSVALGISMIVSIPLGLWTSRSKLVSAVVINFFNALRVVPSIAVLFLAIPLWGLSLTSALMALTFLAFPPVHRHHTPTHQRQVIPFQQISLHRPVIFLPASSVRD